MARHIQGNIAHIFAAIVITLASASAHADLQFSCPLRWDMIQKLGGPDLNADFYGKAVRDWSKADLDQMLAWEHQCDAGPAMPSTMRQVQLANVQNWYNNGLQALAQKDRLLEAETQGSTIAQAVGQNGLTQVTTQGVSPGAAEITLQYLPDAQPSYDQTHYQTRTCSALTENPLGAVTPETLRQALGFANACVQAQQMTPSTFAGFQQKVVRQTALYAAMSDLIRQVSQLASGPAAQQDAGVQALVAKHAQIAKEADALGMIAQGESVPGLQRAETTMQTMQVTSTKRICENVYDKAGMPAAWRSARFMTDVYEMDSLVDVVCLAGRSGAAVRYIPAGLFGDEGFSIETKDTRLQIYPVVQHPGGQQLLLVPAKVKVNGESFQLNDRNSFHQFAMLLLTMMQTH